MAASTVLRLSAMPRRRKGGYFDDEEEEEEGEVSLSTTPYASAPSTPRRVIAPLGEVLAAVPFVWELVPGTPKSGAVKGNAASVDEITDLGRGFSLSSAGESESATLSRDSSSSNTEFEFSSGFTGGVVEPPPSCRAAEELFSNGQLVPLRLPPRLQGLKKQQTVSDSSIGSSPSPRIAESPTKTLGALSSKPRNDASPVFEMPPERTLSPPRSLSPPRAMFNRETGSLDSVFSWSSFSSSFSERKNGHDSPHEDYSPESEAAQGPSTLNKLLLNDMTMASTSRGGKFSTTPRAVQSRRELLKKQQDQWNGNFADNIGEKVIAAPAPTPGSLSRSHARSRPSMDVQVASSLKENLGRATFANRFGMLRRCMGMAIPGSP